MLPVKQGSPKPHRDRTTTDSRVHLRIILKGKRHHNRRVLDVLVVQAGLEVAERGCAGGRERHDLVAAVHQALIHKGLENPPHALHEPGVLLRGVREVVVVSYG